MSLNRKAAAVSTLLVGGLIVGLTVISVWPWLWTGIKLVAGVAAAWLILYLMLSSSEFYGEPSYTEEPGPS